MACAVATLVAACGGGNSGLPSGLAGTWVGHSMHGPVDAFFRPAGDPLCRQIVKTAKPCLLLHGTDDTPVGGHTAHPYGAYGILTVHGSTMNVRWRYDNPPHFSSNNSCAGWNDAFTITLTANQLTIVSAGSCADLQDLGHLSRQA
jgi:hypothetical protein